MEMLFEEAEGGIALRGNRMVHGAYYVLAYRVTPITDAFQELRI